MIVIADTTPLISLLKIKRLDLLQKLFGEVFIPDAVYTELTSDKRFIDEAYAVTHASYIKVCFRIKPRGGQNLADGRRA